MRSIFFVVILILASHSFAKESLWFNSGVNNRDISFSPDGDLLMTTIVAPKNQFSVIALSHKIDGRWTPLETAPFSGEHADIEATFHPKGHWVYFASKRPKPAREGTDWDLWRISYTNGSWGEPENLGPAVNSAGNEFYPSVTNDGSLYFTATREDSLGFEDLYRSSLIDGHYNKTENIGPPVNSNAYEFNAYIAPDESYLIFGSQGRPGETGGGDIYITQRTNGEFGKPRLLGPDINSTRLDYCPFAFQDRFYFTTELADDTKLRSVEQISRWYQSPGNGLGDIYSVPLESVLSRAVNSH